MMKMITEDHGVYCLNTKHTTYAFRIMDTGHLEHLYYGKRMPIHADALSEKYAFLSGNTTAYSETFDQLTLEDICFEMSSIGKGDYREPFICLRHEDGVTTSDFLFEKFEIDQSIPDFKGLPTPHGDLEHLTITLKDRYYEEYLELHYLVYAESDCIVRGSRYINHTNESVIVDRLMSTQLDFPDHDYVFSTFTGAWIREMQKNDMPIVAGKMVQSSRTGFSSNRANPFVMLSRTHTTERSGECYGLNLIYSGNHYEAVEVSAFDKLRFVSGINPEMSSFIVESMDSFESPWAVMTYSDMGFTKMSHQMHHFIHEHVIPSHWVSRTRPVLLNSWEASYFNINESKLLRLAKSAKDVGIELFVMDDGWFTNRSDDHGGLGDWVVDTKKLPNGLKGIADKINSLGMQFGIWVEPEMVNVKSTLYQTHPEWVIEIPGHDHSEGRNQRILDLCNTDVQDYIIEKMSDIFSSANITYVKWDMNRNFSDYYAQSLPSDRQGEVAHRYILGLYRVLETLTNRFPDILFEGCASGGNRFDLGMLTYFPQIWASDNTDAYYRVKAQYNYSYGYPMDTITAHVSDVPNHQTLRNTSLETRFNVAMFGVLGYECNLNDMSKEELEAIKAQIALYKEWRSVLQNSDFYRIENDQRVAWSINNQDRSRAICFLMQGSVEPNKRYASVICKGLDPNATYHFYNRSLKYNIKEFGALVNTASPIHIRHGSMVQDVASRIIKMDGEIEDYHVDGMSLMTSGVKLKQGFVATGYNDQVRLFQDYASRIYLIEKDEIKESE